MIVRGDCLNIIKKIKTESVSLVLTDPPYLIGYKTGHRVNHDFCDIIKGDHSFDYNDWACNINRVLKRDCPLYIFGSWKTEPYFRNIFSKYWNHKNNIIWVKNNWTSGDLKAQFGQQYENIMLYNKGRSFIKGKRFSDIWMFDRVNGCSQLHQNQKPVELLERIIESSTDKGDIVLDPFMGVGSTGVACKYLKRKFIGIEIEQKYFSIAKERIAGAYLYE